MHIHTHRDTELTKNSNIYLKYVNANNKNKPINFNINEKNQGRIKYLPPASKE
jgi:hypothetical protein